MDEIIIEQKKYVSSKQAAKLTGYAKDYVGQLCREGRVPARLVGRSWYVLESAIQDHRFGAQDTGPNEDATEETSADLNIPVFPKYEASPVEMFPSLNKLEETKTFLDPIENEKTFDPKSEENLNESWKEWFDTVGTAKIPSTEERSHLSSTPKDLPPVNDLTIPEGPQEVVFEPGRVVEDIYTPVLRIHRFPDEDFLPNDDSEQIAVNPIVTNKKVRKNIGIQKITMVIQTVLIFLAFVSVMLAVAGSGSFDSHLISSNKLRTVSGASLYIK